MMKSWASVICGGMLIGLAIAAQSTGMPIAVTVSGVFASVLMIVFGASGVMEYKTDLLVDSTKRTWDIKAYEDRCDLSDRIDALEERCDEFAKRVRDSEEKQDDGPHSFEWSGDLGDDCVLRFGTIAAHCERMSPISIHDPYGEDDPFEAETWYFSIYDGDRQIAHSSDPGGMIIGGEMARYICEKIIRAIQSA